MLRKAETSTKLSFRPFILVRHSTLRWYALAEKCFSMNGSFAFQSNLQIPRHYTSLLLQTHYQYFLLNKTRPTLIGFPKSICLCISSLATISSFLFALNFWCSCPKNLSASLESMSSKPSCNTPITFTAKMKDYHLCQRVDAQGSKTYFIRAIIWNIISLSRQG